MSRFREPFSRGRLPRKVSGRGAPSCRKWFMEGLRRVTPEKLAPQTENSGSFRPDQLLFGRSKSRAASVCASSSFANSRSTFATCRLVVGGPGFSWRASKKILG